MAARGWAAGPADEPDMGQMERQVKSVGQFCSPVGSGNRPLVMGRDGISA